MAVTAGTFVGKTAGPGQAILSQDSPPARRRPVEAGMADAIRALSIDAIEIAGAGHPGLPMSMADAATTLWARFHKFDAADPSWPDRDRFVLSVSDGAMLLYSLLHLTGHAGMGIAELGRFRQIYSPTAGNPEFGLHPGIEATTGPLGQGIGTGVGMALAERLLAARFGRSLVDHRSWVIASGADLAAGVSHEAASLAGQLRLEKLTVIWQDNDTRTDDAAAPEDAMRRLATYGWAVKRVDGQDASQLAAALALAMRSKKPTLIAARMSGDAMIGDAMIGDPCAVASARARMRQSGWDRPVFDLPDEVVEAWRQAGSRGAVARRGWLKRLARHPQRAEFERTVAGRLPDNFHDALAILKAGIADTRPHTATRHASQRTLAALAPAMPELIGGAIEPGVAALPHLPAVTPGNYAGRSIPYGTREHGMAAAMNGIALHGGLVPFGVALYVATDCMRPALRLAAAMRQRVVHVLNHDGTGLGEDGPTEQPAEQLACLRALPNLHVFRPADALETAECWELALRRVDGPSVIALSREARPTLRADATENCSARGGYVLDEAPAARQVTLIATGSEVALACEARDILAGHGIHAAVTSLPCWELFAGQDEAYRAHVLGPVLRVGIEAASGFGWERWLGEAGMFIGVDGFGPSGASADVYKHFGITPEAIAAAIRRRLSTT